MGWFKAALTGYYKLAGVDLVREHLECELSLDDAYDIRRGQVVMWQTETAQKTAVFDLKLVTDTGTAGSGKPIQVEDLFFSQKKLEWDSWVEFWRRNQPDGDLVDHRIFRPALR